MKIGERLAEIRQDRGLTQQEVADLLHCAVPTICGYEHSTREPSFDTLVKYAQIFDVTTDYLLGVTDSPIPLSSLENEFADGISFRTVLNALTKLLPEHRRALLVTLKCMQYSAESCEKTCKKGDRKK